SCQPGSLRAIVRPVAVGSCADARRTETLAIESAIIRTSRRQGPSFMGIHAGAIRHSTVNCGNFQFQSLTRSRDLGGPRVDRFALSNYEFMLRRVVFVPNRLFRRATCL